MTFAILLRQLYGIHFGDEKTIETSKKVQMYILPVLNVDGFAYIEEKENVGNFGEDIVLKRKNTNVIDASCPEQV